MSFSRYKEDFKKGYVINELKRFGVVDIEGMSYHQLIGKLSAKRAARE